MDGPWKFPLNDGEAANTEPPIPAILMTSITTVEGELSLALFRTTDRSSGYCALELLSTQLDPHSQPGHWSIDDGVLWIGFADLDWVSEHVEDMDRLGQRMAERAAAWGVESHGGVRE